LRASTICRVAWAVAPAARVTSLGAALTERLAARPIWVCDGPETRETPGKPNSLHGAAEVLVKTIGTSTPPA
jgi:hypothetical protein